jgi:ribulose-phosphate 3-epimerase
MYTFHIEAVAGDTKEHSAEAQAAVRQLCQEIRDSGMYVGVSVKPSTPVESVFNYVHEGLVDMVRSDALSVSFKL